jgi:hypothetical protein
MSENAPNPRAIYENRHEYRQCNYEEIEWATTLADELITAMPQHGKLEGYGYDKDYVFLKASFRYSEEEFIDLPVYDENKSMLTVSYVKTAGALTTETYNILVSHQASDDDSYPPIRYLYTIKYFGKNRESFQATVDYKDLISLYDRAMTSNDMSVYDSYTLLNELTLVQNYKSVSIEGLL